MKRLFLLLCVYTLMGVQDEAALLSQMVTTQPLAQEAPMEPFEHEEVEQRTCIRRVRENPVASCSIGLVVAGGITGAVGSGFACAGLAPAEGLLAGGCGCAGLGALVGCGLKVYQRITR